MPMTDEQKAAYVALVVLGRATVADLHHLMLQARRSVTTVDDLLVYLERLPELANARFNRVAQQLWTAINSEHEQPATEDVHMPGDEWERLFNIASSEGAGLREALGQWTIAGTFTEQDFPDAMVQFPAAHDCANVGELPAVAGRTLHITFTSPNFAE